MQFLTYPKLKTKMITERHTLDPIDTVMGPKRRVFSLKRYREQVKQMQALQLQMDRARWSVDAYLEIARDTEFTISRTAMMCNMLPYDPETETMRVKLSATDNHLRECYPELEDVNFKDLKMELTLDDATAEARAEAERVDRLRDNTAYVLYTIGEDHFTLSYDANVPNRPTDIQVYF